MRKALTIGLILALTFYLSACSYENRQYPPTATVDINTSPDNVIDDIPDVNEMFTNRDLKGDYDEDDAYYIELSGTSASASGGANIDGTDITLTEDATYIISGSLEDGRLIVSAPEDGKPQLVLDGVNITSADSASLLIIEADKVFLTLVGENELLNGGAFSDSEYSIDGAVFSKQDLTINGDGSLTVTSPNGHGIVCKDDLKLTGGTVTVAAASHAIDANDSVRMANVSLTLSAGKDGIHSENNDDDTRGYLYMESGAVKITAEGDGISASAYIMICGGETEILAGGGYENGNKDHSDSWGGYPGGGGGYGGRPRASSSTEASSMKGIKAVGNIYITGGTFKIDSADDAVHTNASMSISGGTLEIATGDDALHVDDTLKFTDGTVEITESYEGFEAHHIDVSGGTITLKATDDGFNAAGGVDSSGEGGRDNMYGGFPGGSSNSTGTIKISGGLIYINSSGDGIDANGTLEISGGDITITGPSSGDTTTLDYDVSGTITGGRFIGTGSSMMAQSFSSSTQGVIALSVGTQAAGTLITVEDLDGNLIVSHSPELSYQIVIISLPELKTGTTYKITVGSLSGEFAAQ